MDHAHLLGERLRVQAKDKKDPSKRALRLPNDDATSDSSVHRCERLGRSENSSEKFPLP